MVGFDSTSDQYCSWHPARRSAGILITTSSSITGPGRAGVDSTVFATDNLPVSLENSMDEKLKRAYITQTLDFSVRMERMIADGRVIPQTIEDIEREYTELKASILRQDEFQPFFAVLSEEPERPRKGKWRGLSTLLRIRRLSQTDGLTEMFERYVADLADIMRRLHHLIQEL
jgi:hypothetical protein